MAAAGKQRARALGANAQADTGSGAAGRRTREAASHPADASRSVGIRAQGGAGGAGSHGDAPARRARRDRISRRAPQDHRSGNRAGAADVAQPAAQCGGGAAGGGGAGAAHPVSDTGNELSGAPCRARPRRVPRPTPGRAMSSASLARPAWWMPALFGVWAAAIALAPGLPLKAALAAPAVIAPVLWWTWQNPARWLALFFGAALLLPPLPIPLGDSGPHPALLFAAMGLLAGVLWLAEWRFL